MDGSGLGLAIAREMLSKMGGALDIIDKGPNELNGTTLRVVLFRDPERQHFENAGWNGNEGK